MITQDDYFGKWLFHQDATESRKVNAGFLLNKVNAMLLMDYPYEVPINHTTGTPISGTQYGGFRPQECPQGAPTSSHKDGRGVDIYDPADALDGWLDDAMLEKYGLYREHPDDTPHWCHLTDRAPGSGKRTFRP